MLRGHNESNPISLSTDSILPCQDARDSLSFLPRAPSAPLCSWDHRNKQRMNAKGEEIDR